MEIRSLGSRIFRRYVILEVCSLGVLDSRSFRNVLFVLVLIQPLFYEARTSLVFWSISRQQQKKSESS